MFTCSLQIRVGGDDKSMWQDDERVKRDQVSYFWECASSMQVISMILFIFLFSFFDPVSLQKEALPSNHSFRWFVSTDSGTIYQDAKNLFGHKILDIPGTPVHIDKFPSGATCDDKEFPGILKTLLDFFVLSSANRLVISRQVLGFCHFDSTQLPTHIG